MRSRTTTLLCSEPARLVLLLLTCLLFRVSLPATAEVVTTEEELWAALADGADEITFEDDTDIALTRSIIITNSVTFDASDSTNVTFSSGAPTGETVQLFVVKPDVEVSFIGITFTGGVATNGGAICIEPGATVTISNCVFAYNQAIGTDGTAGINGEDDPDGIGGDGTKGTSGTPGLGAAVWNAGALSVFATQFLTNNAFGGLGGAGGNGGNGSYEGGSGGNAGNGAPAHGGAIFNTGTLQVVDSEFTRNAAVGGDGGVGGAIGDGFFSARQGVGGAGAPGAGGAIYSPGSLSVSNSTFDSNSAFGGHSAPGGMLDTLMGSKGPKGGNAAGGAIWVQGPSNDETNLVQNCTFYGNSVTGGNGGDGGPGQYTAGDGGNGGDGLGGALNSSNALQVINVTFSSNAAIGGTNGVAGSGPFRASDGSKGAGKGAAIANSKGSLELSGSILATNRYGGNITNLSGGIIDAGYNLSFDRSTYLTNTTSIRTNDARLRPLADNGGPTRTMALLSTSTNAIDKIPPELAPGTDQRGIIRPVNTYSNYSDIGAFEYDKAGPPVLTDLPVNQILPQSSAMGFSVRAYGATPLRYQWAFNGSPLPGATRSAYTLANIQPVNAGTYSVDVTNPKGDSTAVATLDLSPLLVWGSTGTTYGVTNVPAKATNPTAVAAGRYHLLVLRTNGTVLGWGAGTTNLNTFPHYGQARVPTGLSNATAMNVTALAAGAFHSLVVSNGAVVAFGAGDASGSGNTNNFGQSTVPAAASSNIVAVAAGFAHSLALSSNGTVIAWGRTNEFQTLVPLGLANVRAIAAGGNHSLALSNGMVIAWGDMEQSTVPAGLTNVSAIAAGKAFSAALLSNRTVLVWGSLAITTPLTNIVAIAAGENHLLGIDADGGLHSWGTQPFIPRTLHVIAAAGGLDFTAALVQPGSPVAGTNTDSGLPTIVTQPADAVGLPGGQVQFSVIAQGMEPFLYQWWFNSTNELTNQTNATLLLNGLTNGNAGQYSVTVSNPAGAVTSQPATLQIFTNNVVITAGSASESGISVPTVSSFTYELQSTPALSNPSWTTLFTTNGTGAAIVFPVSSSSNAFYRILMSQSSDASP